MALGRARLEQPSRFLVDNTPLAQADVAAELSRIDNALALARVAWHLGNRHTPAQIEEGRILIQPDHVLAEMVEGLGAHVHRVKRPFEPEGGAYGGHGPLHASHHHHHHGDHDHHHGPAPRRGDA